eukprot:superscaffoldBa00000393_g4365
MSGQSRAPPVSDDITPLQRMAASCTGAILTSLLVTPLDVVKIRLQAQKNPFPKGKCFVYCNGLMDHICVCENGNSKAWYKAPGHFSGTLDAFIKIVRNEGIKALWSGLPPTLTELGAATVISPLELMRTKLQSQKLSYRELTNCVRLAVETEGWRSLWRALGPTLLRDVPFSAMYWYNYERSKSWLCERYNTREPTLAISFISGAASGTIASIVTLPFDVVKTRRQVELGELQAMNLSSKASSSTISVMRKIVAQHGFGGLFAGFLPRVVKVAPACAIMISSYELGKAFFRKHNQERTHRAPQTSNT